MSRADAAGNSELEVRLLGPIEIERGGEQVALGGQKPRALLAVLALEPGRVVSSDRLVEALWPGDPPETAAHAVQVYVSQLRKALGGAIATRVPGYMLELDAERLDVFRFERLAQEGRAALEDGDAASAEVALREALALWRGPALADFLYEPFAQAPIARLEELRTVVVEERIEADLALGRHVELVSELEALVQAERLRERPRAQLMVALYRSGRQADALAAYRDARETLVDELGIDPGPELRELEAAILRQDDSLLLEEAPLVRPPMQFRRLVTVLFVDVVESMALAVALDPEALGTVLQRYFATVSSVIERHGGTVEKYAGDAVMAAFGIPISHEDDALRAARAALDVRMGVAALNEQLAEQHGVGLEVRVGIETGEVVATPTDARQRLVTGEVVGIASKLEASAVADGIVVGEVTARLIDHAAQLEPLAEIEIKGLGRTVRAFALVRLEDAAPAFERRLDAPLVGRKRELAALRRSLKRAVDGSAARVAVVTAPPGLGKSRLAAEFARRTKGVTTYSGRCLSYGDGITYWPLREVLSAAPQSPERDAVLTALDAETPPPAPEIAWLFRRFCEERARERALVLVFDDIHWAEPTFLELVDHLADKGAGPILVVCLAREELSETSPDFLDARRVDRIELDALSAAAMEALVDGLGGGTLESDQRTRVVEAAEGNPLFLEQLLALALEGGLTEQRVPETIQALLAARLDRLGPGERAVLERGAVVGKEFRAADVLALLDPDAVATADAHLESLAARGFVRPSGEGLFGFRHVLVQDAAYRAAPKRLRAELHERFADRLDADSPELPELDEFVGYHLEQAYRLRTELGESDRRTERLAEDGGQRLGQAGTRAWRRNDHHATVSLLTRSTGLLRPTEPRRLELLSELGIALRGLGDSEAAERLLAQAVEGSSRSGQRALELRARLELAFVELLSDPGRTADTLIEICIEAAPVFEGVGDRRALGRTYLLLGWVQGGIRCNYRASEDAAERALENYRALGWSTSTCLGVLATAMYYGPTRVSDAVARFERYLESDATDRVGQANVYAFLGGTRAQAGEFDCARELIELARGCYEDLGQRTALTGYSEPVAADVELIAGNAPAAVSILLELCHMLERLRDFNHLSNRASDLAEALYATGDLGESERWVEVGRAHAARDDIGAQVLWRLTKAKLLARQGATAAASSLADEAVQLAEATDGLNRMGRAYHDLGEVSMLGGEPERASEAFDRSVELYERKGNIVSAANVRSRQEPARA